MESANHFSLLDMIEHPAFCARDGIIVRANKAAQHRLLLEGEKVMDFLPIDGNAYAEFQGGCLYLNITSANVTCGASVTRIEDFDLFVLDSESPKLDAYALASLQLKIPLCNVVNILEEIMETNPHFNESIGYLRQNLYQLNRIVLNMSDASWYRLDSTAQRETIDFSDFFREMMEQMSSLTFNAGSELTFQNLTAPVIGLADRERIQRAVSNIISNAIKFSPKGSIINAQLVKKGEFLHFTVSDPGDSQEARCNVFTRYLRTAAIEDSRHG